MDLHHIAFESGWRELVPPSLETYLIRLEHQGITFSWSLTPEHAYLFSSTSPESKPGEEAITLMTCDGSEMPRQAISEVILGTITAKGQFEHLTRVDPRRGLR